MRRRRPGGRVEGRVEGMGKEMRWMGLKGVELRGVLSVGLRSRGTWGGCGGVGGDVGGRGWWGYIGLPTANASSVLVATFLCDVGLRTMPFAGKGAWVSYWICRANWAAWHMICTGILPVVECPDDCVSCFSR